MIFPAWSGKRKKVCAMKNSVVAVNISLRKGEQKVSVPSVQLKEDHGIVGDAHAGDWHRQLSLLAEESIDKMRRLGLTLDPGAFAENITTQGLDLIALPIGTRLRLGEALIEVTQIGKECHSRCAIYDQAGDCVMPKEGIFARVLRGGTVAAGAIVEVLPTSGEARDGDEAA
jgi:MOSC domain-containing protein YiiM